MQPGTAGERLLGTTELGSGVRLSERAELDASGRLMTAEAHLEQGLGQPPVQIDFDRTRGVIVVDSSLTHFEWTVPTDYPWIWAPLLSAGTGKPITTPLLARVVLSSVRDGNPLRILDLGTLHSWTLTADQIVVDDDEGEPLAVVLEDTVQFKAGMPEHLHLSALSTSLDRVRADTSSKELASASCLQHRSL